MARPRWSRGVLRAMESDLEAIVAERPGVGELDLGRGGEGGRIRRLAAQGRLGLEGAPRLVGDAAKGEAHLRHKSSRLHLKKLPTEAPWVIQGPGENAGVIDIGEGPNGTRLAAIFK